MAINQQARFFEKAQAVWDELAVLTRRLSRGGARALSAEELARLDRLYRLTTIHLAQIRTRAHNPKLVYDLNKLAAKAHSLIYAAPPRHTLREIAYFYAAGFPRAVARSWPYHLASLLLFVTGAALGHYVASADAFAAYNLLPAGDIRTPGSGPEQLEAVLRAGREHGASAKLFFAAGLFQHNTKIGFLAFASGVLAGVPAVFLIVTNGALLGAFTAMHHQAGITSELWAWLLPHGITEIGAIILCGGLGLMLGMAVLRPGAATRKASLFKTGRACIGMVMGVIPMFLLAGWIESFVRQSYLTTGERLLFAGATLLGWAVYFGFGVALELRAGKSAGIPNPERLERLPRTRFR